MTPKPGRELDALVEEKLFDRLWPIDELEFVELPHAWHCVGTLTGSKESNKYINDMLPKRSSSIAAAWEVVEKLLGLGYTLELYSPGALINDEFGTHSVGWGAEFCTWGEPYLRSGRVGETVCHTMDEKSGGAAIETTPHAICLAVLKAVE